MKDKQSEWIAISDLMSGVMAVVMLLLVVSVLQKSVTEAKQEIEKSQGYEAKRSVVVETLKGIKAGLEGSGGGGLVSFDMLSLKMTLPDKLFSRSSACIPLVQKSRFSPISSSLRVLLEKNLDVTVYVNGYTDNVAVAKPVIDFERFCAVYDDNYTLSAARAREVRKLLASKFPKALAKRIIVAGYGDSRPLPGVALDSAENRRVEIRLSIDRNEMH